MCGQVGIILGKKRRRISERSYIADLFTQLLVASERRGPHATGVAWLRRDGSHRLFKRPVPASRFVFEKLYSEVLSDIDNRTSLVLGHTRWRTRGHEKVSGNNHPIRAGDILGTHNGTIYNANYLFRRFHLQRFAEVDSELLFRLADRVVGDRAVGDIGIDITQFRNSLRLCRGQMSAVMASRLDPETTVVLKGNKPLHLRLLKTCRAVLYASSPAYLDTVLEGVRGWIELDIPPMSMTVFRHKNLAEFSIEPFEFVSQGRKRRKTASVEEPVDGECTFHQHPVTTRRGTQWSR